ncbi:hypothetical protein QTP70_012836 [Hemibagrus guttatus]|uniref:WxxW domain-containing protein n=1 Tax=Hemibagrus guttatus TaxID=175788 RepID=A0AAE0Q8F2_9TELE|nr:hypothetical protein QTP70_012836 [Hemibagrus guttatus]
MVTSPRRLVSEIQFFTRWFNRDNPGGFGDHETLDRLRVEYPGEICSNPISIEAQTVSGVPAWQTGQVFVYYNMVHGFACVNHQQVNRTCLNYKMLCVILFASGALAAIEERRIEAVEVPPCPRLCYTQWFDRDDPSGYGDYETLLNLRAENPGKICDHPYSIQAQTLTGVFPTGQVFAYYDTVNGFACVNAQQKKPQRCLDYKRDIVSPACPWSSPGSLPGGACPEYLPRETSRRHRKEIPEPPQLSPFNVEEQQLYSELLPGDRPP